MASRATRGRYNQLLDHQAFVRGNTYHIVPAEAGTQVVTRHEVDLIQMRRMGLRTGFQLCEQPLRGLPAYPPRWNDVWDSTPCEP